MSRSLKLATGAPNSVAKPPKTTPTTPPLRVTGARLEFTVITSLAPDRLTKIIGLNPDATLRKESAAHLKSGKARRIQVSGLSGLLRQLNSLASAQAVTWGITDKPTVNICTEADDRAKRAGAIARTRDNFHFASGPGVLMLDHDGLPDGQLSAEQFRDQLLFAAPALLDAPMLWRPSASAGCRHPDGRELTPLTRHRLYLPVLDASLIPDAGKALLELLWACEGNGWIEIGTAGQALQRCLVDACVWQPERLDFAGPPILQNGVTRPNIAGVIYGNGQTLFDLRLLIDSVTPTIRQAAAAARKAAHTALKPKCQAQAKLWAAEHAPALASRRGIKPENATFVLERASLHSTLMGEFELTCSDGQVVTVVQLLDNPIRWHGARFADPLDPDDDHRVAVAYLLSGNRPNIYSHRHGGMRYDLRRPSARVQIGAGMRAESTDAVLRALAESDIFDYGDSGLVHVANGKISPVTLDWLIDHLDRSVEFYRVKSSRTDDGSIPVVHEMAQDAPTQIANAVLAKHGSRGFRRLTAVCTAPVLRADGSVLDTPGHDATTGLLYMSQVVDPPRVPHAPTPDMALDALALLWAPFHEFPFVDKVSVGVMLASLLSAVLRPSLPTCPAFGFDAPAAGSGKTLLANCVATLATGTDVAVLPPASDEDECRKRLFAALRGGERVLIWDNVREPLGNSVIDAFLTSPLFADRILGMSQTQQLPNKALFLVTGNNLVLTGDTHRRVLMARLDAHSERPFMREFAHNPHAQVTQGRLGMVVAALTIVRAYIAAGKPKSGAGRTASFECWDDLVRQPLCWLAKIALASGRSDLPVFADPIESITRSESENPDQAKLSAIHNAWHDCFGSAPTSIATAVGSDSLRATTLHDAMDEIAGQQGKINPRRLGRWIERHAEQRIDGMRFVRVGTVHGVALWQVLLTQERAAANDASGVGAPKTAGGLGGLGGSVSLISETPRFARVLRRHAPPA